MLNSIKDHKNQKIYKYPHICVGMATKNISITEEAYKILERNKKENDSFSRVIVREMGKKGNFKKLREFYGILSKEAGEALEKSILEGRKLHRKMHEKRIAGSRKEFNN